MLLARHNQLSPVAVPQLPAEPLSFARVQGRFMKVLEGWQAQRDASPLRTVQPPLVQEGQRFRAAGRTLFERGDHGALQTYRKDPTTALRMIEVAKQQNWPQVVAQGSQAFRRQAWLYGAVHGLEVQGYQPTKKDLTRLDALKKLQNTLQPGKESKQEPAQSQKPQKDPDQQTEPKQAKPPKPGAPKQDPAPPNPDREPGKNPRSAGLQPASGPKYASRPRTAARQPQPGSKHDFLVSREIYQSLSRHLKSRDPKVLLDYLLHTPTLGVGREPPARVLTAKIKELLPARFHDRIPQDLDSGKLKALFQRAEVPTEPLTRAIRQEARAARRHLSKNMLASKLNEPEFFLRADIITSKQQPYLAFNALGALAKERLKDLPDPAKVKFNQKSLEAFLNQIPPWQEAKLHQFLKKEYPHLQPTYLQFRHQQSDRLRASFPDLARFLQTREPAFYESVYRYATMYGVKDLKQDPDIAAKFPKYFRKEGEAFLAQLTGPDGEKHLATLQAQKGDPEPPPPPKAVKVPRADLGGQLGRQAYQASVKPMPAGPERGVR